MKQIERKQRLAHDAFFFNLKLCLLDSFMRRPHLKGLKNLPVHSFSALIIPILSDCLPNYFFSISFLRRLPDTELEVTS